MKDLGFAANLDTFEALTRAYAEPHRFYHNLVHIDAMLRQFDQVLIRGAFHEGSIRCA